MGDVLVALSNDDPRMIAWEKWKASEDFMNTRKWALKEAHVDGSLWAAFLAGWTSSSDTAERAEFDRLAKQLEER
jgi:hypothetical protein